MWSPSHRDLALLALLTFSAGTAACGPSGVCTGRLGGQPVELSIDATSHVHSVRVDCTVPLDDLVVLRYGDGSVAADVLIKGGFSTFDGALELALVPEPDPRVTAARVRAGDTAVTQARLVIEAKSFQPNQGTLTLQGEAGDSCDCSFQIDTRSEENDEPDCGDSTDGDDDDFLD